MSPVAFDVTADPTNPSSAMLYLPAGSPGRSTLLVLAHGAGAGQSHPFMVRYARGLAARGVTVVTFDFPYMAARRRSPDRAPVLEAAFRRVIELAVAERHVAASRLAIGGKSMGGRMATHLAASPDRWPDAVPALGRVVVFGYPLTPPGASSRVQDRVSHLGRIVVPTLIVQGTRDSFGGPAAVNTALAGLKPRPPVTVLAIDGGDHSLTVSKTAARQDAVESELFDRVAMFLTT